MVGDGGLQGGLGKSGRFGDLVRSVVTDVKDKAFED
jgi:hypothetical protein